MPRAAMEPDPVAVNMIKQNTQYRQVYIRYIDSNNYIYICITVNIFLLLTDLKHAKGPTI